MLAKRGACAGVRWANTAARKTNHGRRAVAPHIEAYKVTMKRLSELDGVIVHGEHGLRFSRDRLRKIALSWLRRTPGLAEDQPELPRLGDSIEALQPSGFSDSIQNPSVFEEVRLRITHPLSRIVRNRCSAI
jgi:hypothetical protein